LIIIVTGGRSFSDADLIHSFLNEHNPELVVQGGCTGADEIARNWCKLSGKECVTINADWDIFGKSAGPRRNMKMLKSYPNAIVVAFKGGSGTRNCVEMAKKLAMKVIEL